MGAAFGKAAPTSELGRSAMLGAAAGRLAGGNTQAARPFGAHRFYSRTAAVGGATPTGAAASLPAQRTPGSGAAAFAAQSARNSARTGARWPLSSRAATTQVAAGPGAHLLGGPATFGRSELDSGAARFGKPNGNSLLRRARSVLALADVVHLLANKLTRLRARRFALALILVCAFQCLLLWHGYPSSENTMCRNYAEMTGQQLTR